MKTALCVLSYGRYDLAAQTIAHNIANCGHSDIGLFVEDRLGIATASNAAMSRAIKAGYEAVVIMGNDILMPEGWLADYAQAWHPTAGMISYPVGELRGNVSIEHVIGSFFIGPNVIDKVGAFNEAFDPYGAIDLDYNTRCERFGFQNFYLPGKMQQHIPGGHGAEGGNEYGFHKPTLINKTWHLIGTVGHIPIIEQEQFFLK
jgi:hypothetical protein